MGLPCHHLVSVLHAVESTTDVMSAFHPSYLVKTFKQIYIGKEIRVVVSTRNPPVSIDPPPCHKHAGRQLKRRIRTWGDTKSGATYKCRTCTHFGHNRTTYRRHANYGVHKSAKVVAKKINLGDASDPLMVLQCVTTATAVVNTLPNETASENLFPFYWTKSAAHRSSWHRNNQRNIQNIGNCGLRIYWTDNTSGCMWLPNHDWQTRYTIMSDGCMMLIMSAAPSK